MVDTAAADVAADNPGTLDSGDRLYRYIGWLSALFTMPVSGVMFSPNFWGKMTFFSCLDINS